LNRVFQLLLSEKFPFSLGRLWVLLQSKRNLGSVPDYCNVIRLARPPKDYREKGKLSAIQLNLSEEFNLSSQDKLSVPPHLSVWVDCLTMPTQAYAFLPDDSPRKLVLRLNVEKICALVGHSNRSESYPNLLKVIWVHIFQDINGNKMRDCRQGAVGHSGITGLDEQQLPNGLSKSDFKLIRKDLRAQLAELASKDCFMMTEE
jgi:hypothetical protein